MIVGLVTLPDKCHLKVAMKLDQHDQILEYVYVCQEHMVNDAFLQIWLQVKQPV